MTDAGFPLKAKVLAATELMVPPHGFSPPHRLALVESEDGTHNLAIVDGELPKAGEAGELNIDAEHRMHWTVRGK
jgi:uncharacterized OB-fold protein